MFLRTLVIQWVCRIVILLNKIDKHVRVFSVQVNEMLDLISVDLMTFSLLLSFQKRSIFM